MAIGLVFTAFLFAAMAAAECAPLPGQRCSALLSNCSYSLYLLPFPMALLLCTAVQHTWGCGLTRIFTPGAAVPTASS